MNQAWERTDQAARLLWGNASAAVLKMTQEQKEQVEEIRLRVGQPLSVSLGGTLHFLSEEGRIVTDPARAIKLEHHHVEECFRKLCGYAVHTHENEIAQGFIALEGGHRAGLGGTIVHYSSGAFGLRDVSSICLRIARQIKGAADPLARLMEKEPGGLLIAGAPGSGKTTVLRDLARQLSYSGKKVTVVDERFELSGICGAVIQNDLGPNCDVLAGGEKSRSILMAIRSLSPQYLVCDELGSAKEIEAVCESLCSGVEIITTIHAGSWEHLAAKPPFTALARSGAFRWVALLSGPGKPFSIRPVGEI